MTIIKDHFTYLSVSAWGFIIVISSMLFCYFGRLIDVFFKCEPTFMVGLLILSICLCLFRFFKEIIRISDH